MGEAAMKEIARWKAARANKPKAKKARTDTEASAEKKVARSPSPEAVKEPPVSNSTSTGERQGLVGSDFKAYVDVPTMEDIERLIITKKKQALLKKYTSADMQKQITVSNTLVTEAT